MALTKKTSETPELTQFQRFLGHKTVYGIIALGFLGLVVQIAMTVLGGFGQRYYAVSLVSGEVYFGKLSFYPAMKMTNTVTLQRMTNEKGETIYLPVVLKNITWKPSGELFFNKKAVVAWGPLASDSPVIPFIENPDALSAPGNPSSAPPVMTPSEILPGEQPSMP